MNASTSLEMERLFTGVPLEKLTQARETELALSDTDEGRDLIALHNLRDAFFYGRHICKYALPDDQVFSACYIALRQAAKNYKPGLGAHVKSRFFGYAKPYVRGMVLREWRAKSVIKHVDLAAIRSFQPEPIDPTEHTLTDRAERAQSDNYRKQDYFEPSVDPEFSEIDFREKLGLVRDAMKRVLSEHERMVIELVYLGHFDLKEIGRQLGVTRSAVFITHARAMKKIRLLLFRETELFDQ